MISNLPHHVQVYGAFPTLVGRDTVAFAFLCLNCQSDESLQFDGVARRTYLTYPVCRNDDSSAAWYRLRCRRHAAVTPPNQRRGDVFIIEDAPVSVVTYGPAAVHELIIEAGWSYPVSARRLERSMPIENVTIDEAGNSMMLSELLQEADIDRFESRDDLKRKLEPVCEAESRSRRTGVLGRLKQTFF